jgi:DtxR family Mn-dependent transcriptional regulator
MIEVGATQLTDWPVGKKAVIIHVEDEPEVVLQQILAVGLQPGSAVRVIESGPERLLISDGEQQHHLAPVVAANIHVQAAPALPERAPDVVALADLNEGEVATVVAIDAAYQGLGRRRLLDLGLTPTATVRADLATTFGDPRAYRVRGTVVALRQDQARQVWVRRQNDPEAAPA